MYDFTDWVVGILIFVLVSFLVIGVPVLIYMGGVSTAQVWNECHPNVQITAKQAAFAKIEMDVCVTKVVEKSK